MRSSLKKGDRVTISGMVGKIVQVNGSTIVFETSERDRVRIEVTKWAVQSTGAMERAAARRRAARRLTRSKKRRRDSCCRGESG